MNPRSLSNLAIAGFILLGAAFIALRYHSRREADVARQRTVGGIRRRCAQPIRRGVKLQDIVGRQHQQHAG